VALENVYVDGKRHVTLTNFGSCTILHPDGHPLHENETTLKGTPQNMAPEILLGYTASKASDMWSVGCLLYELVTATSAFPQTTPLELIKAICINPIEVNVPNTKVNEAVQALLVREPAQRASSTHLRSLVWNNMAKAAADASPSTVTSTTKTMSAATDWSRRA
jgi:serine/threonine protein kinase